MRSPANSEGSRETTGSIGRVCKRGDPLSGPVLTADRLAAPPLPRTATHTTATQQRTPADMPETLPRHQETAGDQTRVETPVPIPNTADKHPGPMVVRPAR